MTNDTARILANCLDAIEQRGWTLEECMARYPDQRLTLSELLPVAQTLQAAPSVVPSLDFRMDARQQLLARLPTHQQARRSQRAKWVPRRVAAVRVGLLLLVAATLATSVVTASAQALPNDALYPVKRSIEHIRLALAADNVRSGDLRLAFAAERLGEVARLTDMGRGADVAAAVDEFAAEMQSVVSFTQTMPDTTDRAALIARVAESIKSSNTVLSATQARLPASAQVAITRVRALLAERENFLRRTPPPVTPMITASATPDRAPLRQPAPSLIGTLPPVRSTIPPARPTLIWRPTALPSYESTPRPAWQPNMRLTGQPSHTMSALPIIPTYASPAVRLIRSLPVIPTFEPPHLPTPIPHSVRQGSGHLH